MKDNTNSVKVIGRITLPSLVNTNKHKCADCGSSVSDSFGDPRVTILTYDSMDSKVPSSSRKVCAFCADELFGDSSPYSIFG